MDNDAENYDENLDELNVSSYQKGINRLLEHKSKFEHMIIEYLLSVNSKYNSTMFPTPQIAKILLNKLNMKKTQFPIIHKIVRTIFEDWCNNEFCEYVTTTKSGRNRRTKFIYKFSPENIQMLKGRFISSSINAIEKEIMGTPDQIISDTMKSREIIVEGWISKVQDAIDEIDISQAEKDDIQAEKDSDIEPFE